MIKLFDVDNGVVIPTEHCYSLKTLNTIIEDFPDDYMNIFLYLFYMTCPNPELNPFFEVPEHEKEELILSQLKLETSLDDDRITEALAFCSKLYETPTLRAYLGIKGALDKLALYMGTTDITAGRDGNINSIVAAASKFDSIRMSFQGAYKDLMEEQKSQIRGNRQIGYDQS